LISEVVPTSSARKDYDDCTAKHGRYGIPIYLVVDPYAGEVVLHTQPTANGYSTGAQARLRHRQAPRPSDPTAAPSPSISTNSPDLKRKPPLTEKTPAGPGRTGARAGGVPP
jgi:hypothetical protein